MGCVRVIGNPFESQRPIERVGNRVVRAQAEPLERLARGVPHRVDESAANSCATELRQDVEPPEPARFGVFQKRIPVEAADADKAPVLAGHKERFPRTFEPVRPGAVFVAQTVQRRERLPRGRANEQVDLRG